MHSQRGFSLLEVMIAGTLLAIALLAQAALAARALQTAAEALDQRMATILLTDLRQRVTLITRQGTGPAPASALEAEYGGWQFEVRRLLPRARTTLCRSGLSVPDQGSAACTPAPGFAATVEWRRFPFGNDHRRRLAWSP